MKNEKISRNSKKMWEENREKLLAAHRRAVDERMKKQIEPVERALEMKREKDKRDQNDYSR